MTVNRRRFFRAAALTGAGGTMAEGQAPAISLDALRNVSAAHGISLSDERLRILQPVLEQRKAQLQSLRDFEIDDRIEPTHGCL